MYLRMCVGRSLFAYLMLRMIGCSLPMILLIVWWCLRLSCSVIPRSGACVFCLSVVVWTVSCMGSGDLGKMIE